MEYLTNTEELMMKCIWNYGKEMPFLRMGEELKDKFHKEYKPRYGDKKKGYFTISHKSDKDYAYA